MNGNDSRINILDVRRLVDNVYANDIMSKYIEQMCRKRRNINNVTRSGDFF